LVVLAFAFEIFFNDITTFVILNVLENLFFAFALVCPLYFFYSIRYKRFYFGLSYILFFLCLYFETIYYYMFQTFFSASAIFVALDSNADESVEFLSFYVDAPVVLCAAIFLVVIFWMLFKSKQYYHLIGSNIKFKRRYMVFLFFVIILFVRQSDLIRFNLPYLIIKSGTEYAVESKKLGDYKNNKTGNFENVSRLSHDDEHETYVVIIGESTSRSHLGIYGYYRETTPGLNAIKDQLLIYNDAISPHAYSVGALTKILTLGNYESPKNISVGSIIQLLNSAGFDTYWLSNQRPIGPFESMITKISLSSGKHRFLTTTLAGNSTVLDEGLLDAFDEVLSNNVKKRVI